MVFSMKFPLHHQKMTVLGHLFEAFLLFFILTLIPIIKKIFLANTKRFPIDILVSEIFPTKS